MAQDYILRLIEQIASMIAGLLARRRAGQVIEAREDLENLSVRTMGLPLANIKAMAPEALAQLLEKSGALRITRAITIAELLLLDAEWKEADHSGADTLPNYAHAFCLLADSMETLSVEEQKLYRPKLEKLAARLGALREHPYINERLRDFALWKSANQKWRA